MNPTTKVWDQYTSAAGSRRFETTDELVQRLDVAGLYPRRSGTSIRALCPVHELTGEHSRSLNIDPKDVTQPSNGWKFYCFGGCSQDEVLRVFSRPGPLPRSSATLKTSALINGGRGLICSREIHTDEDFLRWSEQTETLNVTEDYYHYRDTTGGGGYVKVTLRIDGKRESEFFAVVEGWGADGLPVSVRRSSLKGPLPLYGTHLLADAADDEIVYIVEGEKDVETLARCSRVAVSMKRFGGGYMSEFIAPLSGRNLVLIPDNDDHGVREAKQFAAHVNKLPGVAVRVLPPFPGARGYDVTDWINDGGTVAHLDDLARQASALQPPDDRADTVEELYEQDDIEARQRRVDAIADAFEERLEGQERGRDRYNRRRSKKGARLNLKELLVQEPPVPTVGRTNLGNCLFYESRYNAVYGPGGYGKTWLGLYCIAETVKAGHHAVFFSYELDGVSVSHRLHENFGVTIEELDRVHFYDDRTVMGHDAIEEIMETNGGIAPKFVLLDSVRELLAARGANGYTETDISKLVIQDMSDPFTKRGAAFVSIDHTNNSTRDRASGSSAKSHVVQGVVFQVEDKESLAFNDHLRGYTAFSMKKDNGSGMPWKRDDVCVYLYADSSQNPTRFELVESKPDISWTMSELQQMTNKSSGVTKEQRVMEAIRNRQAPLDHVTALSRWLSDTFKGSASSWRVVVNRLINGDADQGVVKALHRAEDGRLSVVNNAQ